MSFALKRVYEEAAPADGYRVLVDRLWPRGVSKEAARLDAWLRDEAPSDELRRRFHEGELTWGEFRRAYLAELKDQREGLRPLAERARGQKVTLLFARADPARNNAVVLKQYLERLGRRRA